MITVLLLACYLPVAAVPLVVPWPWIQKMQGVVVRFAWIPLGLSALALALAGPLTRVLSYGVVLVPLAISFLSLAMATAGARLVIRAARDRLPWQGLALRTLLAALPSLAVLPYLLVAVLPALQALFAS